MPETKSMNAMAPETMVEIPRPADMRKSLRARLAGATFLAMLVLISPLLFLFTTGIGPKEVYILVTGTAFTMMAILWALWPLVDVVFSERQAK